MTTRRPVRPDDAEAVLEMWHRHQTAVLGFPDSTADDARDMTTDPELDPESPVVLEDDGRVLACALLLQAPGSDTADLDVVVDPQAHGLLQPLLEDAMARARTRGAGAVTVTQACYRADDTTAGVLRDLGFAPATTFHRMRRDLDAPVEVALPDGVAVERPGEQTADVLRRTHALYTTTFAGHDGFVARDLDAFLEQHHARTDPGRIWFASVDGAEAGFLHETDQFVEDERAGYVWRLGVLPEARGRGVAKALLLSAFADMRERGREAVLLHVDTANATGATRLYEAVGMRPVLVFDMWRREV